MEKRPLAHWSRLGYDAALARRPAQNPKTAGGSVRKISVGLMIHSLCDLPLAGTRDFYVYLLDYGWDEQLTRELYSNFQKMAEIASKYGAVVLQGTVGHHFADEVLSWHHVNGRDATGLLPAILVTTRHPRAFREGGWDSARLLLIPLRGVCRSPAEVAPLLEQLFADIRQKRELSHFQIAEQMAAGSKGAILDALLLRADSSLPGLELDRATRFLRQSEPISPSLAENNRTGVAMSTIENPVRVFVSYTHEDAAQRMRVTSFVEDLRAQGIDAKFDRDVFGTPEPGWPAWMDQQVAEARYVLVVCTETYLRRFERRELPGAGKGAIWEGSIIQQEMYDEAGNNRKFAAILFDEHDERNKPRPLRPHTHYFYPRDRTNLLRWLTNQPSYIPRPLGNVPVLPPDP